MTLNIIAASPRVVHVGADFQLTDANSGKVITQSSPKVLVLNYPSSGWQAVVSYCGVGRWQGRETSDWIKGWLQHDPPSMRSFDEVATILQQEGNVWLAEIRAKGRYAGEHTFILAGIVDGASKVALISNVQRLRKHPSSVARCLSIEYAAPDRRVIITGQHPLVSRADVKSLDAAVRRGDEIPQVQRQIGRIIADAARHPNAKKTVSSASYSYSIPADGNGLGHLHRSVRGTLQIDMISDGVDLSNALRGIIGPGKQTIVTASMLRPDTAVEHCEPELEDSLDREGAVSGYKIVPLGDLGSGFASAESINASGVVVGQSNEKPSGPLASCVWLPEGALQVLQVSSLSSWAMDINDRGAVAGTAHTETGSRAFLFSDKASMISGTLGGMHANAHALNNCGDVVGGSWSIPGNSPGGKRERAFRWIQGRGLEDLGVLRTDWCSRAVDINDNGTIVGYSFSEIGPNFQNHAFVWTPAGGMIDLGPAAALAINNREEVVGLAHRHGRSVSFIWTETQRMRLLDLPERSSVCTLNDRGEIVYTRDTTRGARAFLLSGGGTLLFRVTGAINQRRPQ